MRSLHVDPSLRARDKSTDAHYVSRFVFKVNNTFFVTRVSLNRDPEKPQDLEAHTLKNETDEVKSTGVEQIRNVIKLAKELEKRHGAAETEKVDQQE